MLEPAGFYDNTTESLDDLLIGGLKYIQAKSGYRFSVDSVLLAHFPILDKNTRAVDLGAGNGLLALLLSQRCPGFQLSAVEMQPAMADRARRNVKMNELEDRIEVLQADIKEIRESLSPGTFSLAVCNPPFFKDGSGKTSRNEEERLARHEILASLKEFLQAAVWLLEAKGRLSLIIPVARLQELMVLMSETGLVLARLRLVYSRREEDAVLAMVEAAKGGHRPAQFLPPLVIYSEDGSYTGEIVDMYGGKS